MIHNRDQMSLSSKERLIFYKVSIMDNLSERIKSELLEKADPKYREFHSGLVPGTENIMGVRIPELRKIARSAAKEDWRNYLEKCCPDTYEEVMILLSNLFGNLSISIKH